MSFPVTIKEGNLIIATTSTIIKYDGISDSVVDSFSEPETFIYGLATIGDVLAVVGNSYISIYEDFSTLVGKLSHGHPGYSDACAQNNNLIILEQDGATDTAWKRVPGSKVGNALLPPLENTWTSSALRTTMIGSWANNNEYSVSVRNGVRPVYVALSLICNSAQLGYSVGDVVYLDSFTTFSGGAAFGATVYWDESSK